MQVLQESNGKFSATRLMFIIGSIWNMLMTSGLAFFSDTEIAGLIAFYSAIQGVLIGLKLGNKTMEGKE